MTEISELDDTQEEEYDAFDIDCTDNVNMDSLVDSDRTFGKILY